MNISDVVTMPMTADQAAKAVAAATLSVLIAVTFVYVLVLMPFKRFRRARYDAAHLLGGLIILLFALATNNAWVQWVSLFIGGLLIASENFLMHLAAVFRSAKEGVPSILDNWRKLSGSEIEAKQLLELEEQDEDAEDDDSNKGDDGPSSGNGKGTSKDVVQATPKDKKNPSDTKKTQRQLETINSSARASSSIDAKPVNLVVRLAKLQSINEAVLAKFEYLIRYENVKLRKFIKVKLKDRSLFADAVLVADNTNKIKTVIEIKYFETLNIHKIQSAMRRTAALITGDDYDTVLVLVVEEYKHETVDYILEYRSKLKKQYKNLGIIIYQSETKSSAIKLEALNDEDKDMFKDNDLSNLPW